MEIAPNMANFARRNWPATESPKSRKARPEVARFFLDEYD